MAYEYGIAMALWGKMSDILKIPLRTHTYTETHQCISHEILNIQGYRWELLCNPQQQILGSTRGCGIAITNSSLHTTGYVPKLGSLHTIGMLRNVMTQGDAYNVK